MPHPTGVSGSLARALVSVADLVALCRFSKAEFAIAVLTGVAALFVGLLVCVGLGVAATISSCRTS
jgi:hypothetical protein